MSDSLHSLHEEALGAPVQSSGVGTPVSGLELRASGSAKSVQSADIRTFAPFAPSRETNSKPQTPNPEPLKAESD